MARTITCAESRQSAPSPIYSIPGTHPRRAHMAPRRHAFERDWGAGVKSSHTTHDSTSAVKGRDDDDSSDTFANCSGGLWLFDVRRDPTERHNLYWDPSLASVREELERRVRYLYETEWVQHTDWVSAPSSQAREAFLDADQFIVPWGCDVIE